VFLSATLRSADTVLVRGAPAVGDEDGWAGVVVRIQGDQACFTVRYRGIEAPSAAHVHAAAAGKDGPVAVSLFEATLPRGLSVVTGCVTQDLPTLRAIIAVPELHHVDVHTAEFPGGAVRGQLRTEEHAVDLLSSLGKPMVAMLDGAQAVPVAGDRDGRATGFVRPRGDAIDFAFTFTGIAPPTAGRLGPGAAGEAGGAEVELFRRAGGLPPSVLGVAGTARADRATVAAVAARPHDFHLDLDNADHAGGALRGQLSGR
jgi:hypothetical protein